MGVAPLETDISHDGFKFVLSAGAPLTVGNTNDALLRAALRIVDIDSPFELRVGVQTGRVFAGFIGHPNRRTYSMMGDCMSTAARMLGVAADRDVVAVDDVVAGTRVPFVTEALEPFAVKGKSAPITAHRIVATEARSGGKTGQTAPSTGALIGRDDMIAEIVAGLAPPGAHVEIAGEPGAGKTALLAAAIDALEASEPGTRDRIAAITAHDSGAAPYADIAPGLSELLGLGPTPSETALAQLVRAQAAEMSDRLPLIAQSLGLNVPETATTLAIEKQFRRDAVVAATTALLGAVDPDSERLLVIDDAHWLDESSAALLAALIASGTGTGPRLLTTTRHSALPGPLTARVSVEPLADSDVRRLASEHSDRALSDAELDAIVERSSGNPLLITELTRAATHTELDGLPDSIEQLVAVRIDALAPASRRILRLAAVVGLEFDVGTLAALLGIEHDGAEDVLRTGLDDLVVPVDGDQWAFDRSVHRDVAYVGLPFSERKRLHGEVGERLAAHAVDDIESVATKLSIHWANAGRHDQAWIYSVLAGDRAAEQSSPHEAVEAYTRALDAARHTRSVSAEQRAEVAIRLGDVAETAGRYDIATSAYQRAQRALDADDPRRLGLFRRRGVLHEREGRYGDALRWYQRGLAEAARRHDEGEARELEVALAGIRFRQGRYEACISRAVEVADDTAASATIRLRACYVVQLAAQYLGERNRRNRYGRLGLDLAAAADDAVLEANLYNNLGISAYYEGDFDLAADLYGRAYDLRTSTGDLIGAVTSVNNLGELRSDQGRFDEAQELFEQARRRATAAGYEMAVHVAQANLGRLATRRGERDIAEQLLLDARAGFERMESTGFALEARLRLLQNEPPEQLDERMVLDLINDSARLGAGATVDAPARRLLAGLRRRAGDVDGARDAIERALATAQLDRLDSEIRTCQEELAALDNSSTRWFR